MTTTTLPSLIPFTPAFFERIWGGQAMAGHFGFPLPEGARIGEAWLVSDHPVHESVVQDGPLEGETLRALMQRDPRGLLGSVPVPAAEGRFPLLLKLLDAQEDLSVQVHPDDHTAGQLGETDGGKTEAWHILHAGRGCEIISGLEPGCTLETFLKAAGEGDLEPHLRATPVAAGDSFFVPAGTVHAIGKGILLAEIQQNSDLTYRIHDYNRPGPDGSPRPLHLEAARQATQVLNHADKSQPVTLPLQGAVHRTLEAACPHFAVERVALDASYSRKTGGRSFHILLPLEGTLTVSAHGDSASTQPGHALLLPGAVQEFEVTGQGVFLDCFVADAERDILKPMRAQSVLEQKAHSFHYDSIRAEQPA